MADAKEFDWGSVGTGTVVNRAKTTKAPPVPDQIVKLAQMSFDGEERTVDGETVTLHVRQHRFPSEEVAATFASHMRNAGDHTTPPSSISVSIDPDQSGDKRTVAWRAGKRRGRQAS